MDSTHASCLGHALPTLACIGEAAPACTSDKQNAAYDRQGDGESEFPAVKPGSGGRTAGCACGTGYQRLVEDRGRVGEEWIASHGRLPAGDVECL